MLDIKTIVPNTPILKKHIIYYYFLKSEDMSTKIGFINYPHYVDALNIHTQAKINITDIGREVYYDPHARISSIYTCNKISFRQALVFGKYDIIGVLFHPLGMNYFIRTNLNRIFPEYFSDANQCWTDFSTQMSDIFRAINMEEKAALLDAFFLTHYQPFQLNQLSLIVDYILKYKGDITVHDITDTFGVNRRTLLRQFKTHLKCSVIEFIRIVKFRSAIDTFYTSNDKVSMTQLAHDNNYYDQSDFIHQFKKFTGDSPNKILKHLSLVGDETFFWNILK